MHLHSSDRNCNTRPRRIPCGGAAALHRARYDAIVLIEVQSGSKAGRPALLIVSCGVLLALSVGAAWFQTRDKLALGPPRPLSAGSPVTIQPPRGWIENQPGRFVLLQHNGSNDERAAFEQRVQFIYRYAPYQLDPRVVIRDMDQQQAAQTVSLAPAPLGGIEGIEGVRHRRTSGFGTARLKETILRVACFPTGDIVCVEYWPLEEFTVADQRLMDAICAAIRLKNVNTHEDRAALLARAGVDFPIPPNCGVVGNDAGGLPSLFLVPALSTKSPFRVQIGRTWLAAGRSPQAILSDYYRAFYAPKDRNPRIVERGRPDQVDVHVLYSPQSDGSMPLAALLTRAAGDCVLLTYRGAADGSRLVDELADAVRLTGEPTISDLAEARQSGLELANLIHERGATPWWARARQDARFVGKADDVDFASSLQIAPAPGAAPGAYQGGSTAVDSGKRLYLRREWTLDGRASGYILNMRFKFIDHFDPEWSVVESRDPAEDVIHRRLALYWTTPITTIVTTTPIGPDFVAPPAESIAAGWVAGREKGDYLISVSNPQGAGVCSRLLRALPPSGRGERRVLVVDDYDPTAWIALFDADDRPLNDRFRGVDLDRIDERTYHGSGGALGLLNRAERDGAR